MAKIVIIFTLCTLLAIAVAKPQVNTVDNSGGGGGVNVAENNGPTTLTPSGGVNVVDHIPGPDGVNVDHGFQGAGGVNLVDNNPQGLRNGGEAEQ